MFDWMNDEKNDEIDWMDVWMNEGMKKIREYEVSGRAGFLHRLGVS